MKPVRIDSTQKKHILNVRWNPNNVCNFQCRYCFPDANTGTHRSPEDLDLVIRNWDHLLNFYKTKLNKSKFQFFIAGGEPTLWKDLGIFMAKIKKKHNAYISLISNGSRTVRWWKEHAEEIDNAHLTLHLAQGDVDHMIEVSDILYAAGSKVTVKVLMDPERWSQGIEAIAKMKKDSKHPWFIMVAEVIEPHHISNKVAPGVKRYDEKQLQYLKKDLKRWPSLYWFWKNRRLLKDEIRLYESKYTMPEGNVKFARPGTYINEGWNEFKDWKCNIGLESIYVDWNGDLKGACNAKLYDLNYSHNILKADFATTFDPIIKPVTCPFAACFCMPETQITKWKI